MFEIEQFSVYKISSRNMSGITKSRGTGETFKTHQNGLFHEVRIGFRVQSSHEDIKEMESSKKRVNTGGRYQKEFAEG